ncbi:cytochrome c [Paenibacillus sp. BSR1-1]|uniref:c-type cytochrome n=1 Tax=Paenibacillus sp. BSR1-1 TaxID=3020845 RepID=UPI0025AED974|nr:cytochrome c [Paenibacillus sp. BSR1-1]MDN3016023.1 cytochrome c [Paenibacillus sp. BSR1-1]
MKKIFGFAIFFILLIGIMSACGKDDSDSAKEPAKEPAKQEESKPATALAGDEVFQKSCITCHSSGNITGGQKVLDANRIHTDFKTKEDLQAFISKNMPKSAPASLSKEEYDAVVSYLWDQK